MVGLTPHDEKTWLQPVLKTEAIHKKGLDEVMEEMGAAPGVHDRLRRVWAKERGLS